MERINEELIRLGERALGQAAGPRSCAACAPIRPSISAPAPEIVERARACLARADEVTPRWFGRLPAAPCVVVEMGAHEAKDGTIAYYLQPAADGSRPGQYFINTWAPETRPRYEAEALAYHEAVPGHHLQIALAQELEALPRSGATSARPRSGKAGASTPSACGTRWASTRATSTGSGCSRSTRGARAGSWSTPGSTRSAGRARHAIDFMVENTALAENNIVNEVDRYIVWPGQALAYKTGQLEMLRLRAEARGVARPPIRHPRLPRRAARRGRARPEDARPRRPCETGTDPDGLIAATSRGNSMPGLSQAQIDQLNADGTCS